MKKLCQCKLPLLLALVLALPLYGCSASSGGERAASTASAPQLNGLTSDQVQFYQVQTSLWESESPRRCVLTSADAFADFSAAHSNVAEDPAFLEAVGTLDQSFFDENILLCALITTGSGSDRYAITGLERGTDGQLTMTVKETPAELGTADLAEWFLLARVSRDALDTVPEDFQLVVR